MSPKFFLLFGQAVSIPCHGTGGAESQVRPELYVIDPVVISIMITYAFWQVLWLPSLVQAFHLKIAPDNHNTVFCLPLVTIFTAVLGHLWAVVTLRAFSCGGSGGLFRTRKL